eukprot:Lankesteria_metandrocarpae@DN8276_c0_g1_i1.p1
MATVASNLLVVALVVLLMTSAPNLDPRNRSCHPDPKLYQTFLLTEERKRIDGVRAWMASIQREVIPMDGSHLHSVEEIVEAVARQVHQAGERFIMLAVDDIHSTNSVSSYYYAAAHLRDQSLFKKLRSLPVLNSVGGRRRAFFNSGLGPVEELQIHSVYRHNYLLLSGRVIGYCTVAVFAASEIPTPLDYLASTLELS